MSRIRKKKKKKRIRILFDLKESVIRIIPRFPAQNWSVGSQSWGRIRDARLDSFRQFTKAKKLEKMSEVAPKDDTKVK